MKYLLVFILFIGISVNAQSISGYQLATKQFKIESAGKWDYITLDLENDRIYASHATQVNIVNKSTGDSVSVIPNTAGVHGIALVHQLNKGFTTNGKSNNLTVFDINTFKILGKIATGENPDAILYDSISKYLVVSNGDSHNISLIDPASEKNISTIDVGGAPEAAVSDGKNIYLNIEDKNEIVVIDLLSKKVINHWGLSGGEAPTGLAIDLKNGILFSVCKNGLCFILDAKNGKIISKIAIGNGCDGVVFDPILKYAFTANGASGNVSIIKEETNRQYKLLENVKTKIGAKTLALDVKSHKVYLLAADLNDSIKDNKGRSAMIPGTFQVLILENNNK